MSPLQSIMFAANYSNNVEYYIIKNYFTNYCQQFVCVYAMDVLEELFIPISLCEVIQFNDYQQLRDWDWLDIGQLLKIITTPNYKPDFELHFKL